jgi:hypothetical protein
LVAVVVNHALEVVDVALSVVLDDVIMDRTSSTLNSGVGIEVEVVLKGMSNFGILLAKD